MRIPPRILAPILLATACAGTLMFFLWWQLSQSTVLLTIGSEDDSSIIGADTTIIDDFPIDPSDIALIHLRQGDLLGLRGEWAAAQVEYEVSVEAGGGLPALRKLAQAQMQRRDSKGVRSTIKKLKSAGARSEDIILLESIMRLRDGELAEARALLDGSADSPQKHYGLALLAIIQGNHELVLAELQLVINGWDPVLRSYARTLQAAYDEFSLFPESTNTHLITLLSRALAQVQECELALPLLIQVTQVNDNYRDALIVQGYCELITERPEQALVSLEQAYGLDPQKPEIQYFLARAHGALYEYQNAITFLEYSLTNGFQPESEVRRFIAEYALEIGNAGLALEQYKALTELENATIESYEGYVAANTALERVEDAYITAKEAVERWPEDSRAYELLADAALALERKDEAKAALEKVLDINPHAQEARAKLLELSN